MVRLILFQLVDRGVELEMEYVIGCPLAIGLILIFFFSIWTLGGWIFGDIKEAVTGLKGLLVGVVLTFLFLLLGGLIIPLP